MLCQKLLRFPVDEGGTDATSHLRHSGIAETREVVVYFRDDIGSRLVYEDGAVAILFGGFCPKGDEHGFGNGRKRFCFHEYLKV